MHVYIVCILPPPEYDFINFFLIPSHSDPAFHSSVSESSVKVPLWEFSVVGAVIWPWF